MFNSGCKTVPFTWWILCNCTLEALQNTITLLIFFFKFHHLNVILSELNYVLDRNTCIAHMMATDLADQCPDVGPPMQKLIPHTRASFKIQVKQHIQTRIWHNIILLQDVIPKSHLASFKLTENEMKLIKPEDIEESERFLEEKKGQRQRLGVLVRAMDEAKR